jgi:hypothetical protein
MRCRGASPVEVCQETMSCMQFEQSRDVGCRQTDVFCDCFEIQQGITVSVPNPAKGPFDLDMC